MCVEHGKADLTDANMLSFFLQNLSFRQQYISWMSCVIDLFTTIAVRQREFPANFDARLDNFVMSFDKNC